MSSSDENIRQGVFFVAVASFLSSLRFLTIIPVPYLADRDGEFFQPGLFWFPVIGLIGGTGVSFLVWCSLFFVPDQVAIALGLILLAAISGGLHLDGLADTFDGFLSSRPREQIFAIMRDSRIGVMGVLVLIFTIMVKYSCLTSVSRAELLTAFVLMPVAGRCALVFSMALLTYARKDKGLGVLFYSSNTRFAAITALVFYIFCIIVIAPHSLLLILLLTFIPLLLFSFWCKRVIGGATGDTLGASCELTELACALAFAVAAH